MFVRYGSCRSSLLGCQVLSDAGTTPMPRRPQPLRSHPAPRRSCRRTADRQGHRAFHPRRPRHGRAGPRRHGTEGIASLSGSVGNLLAREKAGEIAGTIRGVRSVVNRITVAASARTDDDIKSEVLRVLREDHPDRANALGASVKGGIVTLSGATKTWQEKALLLDECKAVAGGRGVEDTVASRLPGRCGPKRRSRPRSSAVSTTTCGSMARFSRLPPARVG